MKRLLAVQEVLSVSVNEYFDKKKERQIEHLKTIPSPEYEKMKKVHVNFRGISSNFFTKTLPIKKYEFISMPDKTENILENSYICLEIPIKSDKEIQNFLTLLSSKEIRTGKILECMDSLACIVGCFHCFGDVNGLNEINPFLLMTACIDKINLFEMISIEDNVTMEGFVNYVGNTSMEIEINLFQKKVLKASALFTMVAREVNNFDKSFPCPKLKISHLPKEELEKANIRLKDAEKNVELRKISMKESYKIKPPTKEDSDIIHQIFVKLTQKLEGEVDIQTTHINNFIMMHPQEMNMNKHIFGGFLMREMLESGGITASKFAGHSGFKVEDLTDIYFKSPVEVGCLLKISSRVSYTFNDIIVVTIEAWTEVFEPERIEKLCCYMHVFLRSCRKERKVYPKTYEDAIYYLTSKNAYKKIFKHFTANK